jgi:hypothetical protein
MHSGWLREFKNFCQFFSKTFWKLLSNFFKIFCQIFSIFILYHVGCLCTRDDSRSPKNFVKLFSKFSFQNFLSIFEKFMSNIFIISCEVSYALGMTRGVQKIVNFFQNFFSKLFWHFFQKFVSKHFIYYIMWGGYAIGMTPGVCHLEGQFKHSVT